MNLIGSWMLAVALLALLGGCAQEALLKPTQSGMAEARFENASLDDVRDKLIGWCSQKGASVLEATSNQVVCSRTTSGGEAMMTQLLIGNSYSTTPEMRARFTMYRVQGAVKVVASQWAETVMPFGQVRRVELDGPHHINRLQEGLDQIVAESAPAGAAPAGAAPTAMTAAPRSSGAQQIGRHSYTAEQLPEVRACAQYPVARLNAQGSGYETFTVDCTNGDALAVRCESAGCRVLR